MTKNQDGNRRENGSHQIRRRSKRGAQGRRRIDSRQGPLHRRPCAGDPSCPRAALTPCAREMGGGWGGGGGGGGGWGDPHRRRREGSRRSAMPVQSGSRSVHRTS